MSAIHSPSSLFTHSQSPSKSIFTCFEEDNEKLAKRHSADTGRDMGDEDACTALVQRVWQYYCTQAPLDADMIPLVVLHASLLPASPLLQITPCTPGIYTLWAQKVYPLLCEAFPIDVSALFARTAFPFTVLMTESMTISAKGVTRKYIEKPTRPLMILFNAMYPRIADWAVDTDPRVLTVATMRHCGFLQTEIVADILGVHIHSQVPLFPDRSVTHRRL